MPDLLEKRCQRFLERADEVWRKEDMDTRIAELSSYYHHGYGAPNPDPNVVRVNKVYPRVRTRVASMHARRPEVLVKPRRAGFDQASMSAELALNYFTRFMKYSAELRECLFYASLYPYGVLKYGMEDKAGLSLPMMRAWHPKNFRCDTTMDTFRPQEAQWQAFRFRRSLAVVEAAGIYDEKKLDQFRDTVGKNMPDWTPDTVEIWLTEHYLYPNPGKKAVQIMVSADGFNDIPFASGDSVWVRNDKWTDVIGLPGRVLAFVPSPLTWNPISPIELWLDQLKLGNLFETLKVRAAQRSIPKTFVNGEALGDAALETLESSHAKQIIVVKNPPPGGMEKVSAEMESHPINTDVIRGAMDAENHIQEIDGSSGVQLGRSEPERGSTSATRDSLIESNFRLRASQDQEIWEDFIEDGYQSILNLAQTHMTGEMWIKTTGVQERRLSKQEIQLDADVVLAFGSTQPRDREKERADARELFTLLVNNPGINQAWLNRYVLQKQGDVKDIDGALMIAPPPPGLGGMPGAPQGMGMPPAAPPLDAAAMTGVSQDAAMNGQSPLSLASMFRNMA